MARRKYVAQFFNVEPLTEDVRRGASILNVLKKGESFSVKDISCQSGISQEEVEGHLDRWVKNGLLRSRDVDKGGKFTFNDTHTPLLGIGFSGKKCHLVCLDLKGNIMAKERILIEPWAETKGRNKAIKRIVERIENETRMRNIKFAGVGIAIPQKMKELSGKGTDILAEKINRLFKNDSYVINEVTAAGYGERDFGGQTRGKDVLYLHSDVGAGVVIRKEMISTPEGADMEKGSSYLRPWQQYDIAQIAKDLANKGVGTEIVNMVEVDISGITLQTVLEAAENHDELAEDLVRRSGLALGVRAAYLANLFNVEMVVLGGGVEKKEGDFLGFVKESARIFLVKDIEGKLAILPGVLGEDASAIGAASLCCRKLFMEV